MNNKLLTILLSIIAIATVYIAVCQSIGIKCQQTEVQWEYGGKDMIDVDPSKTKFEDWNEWTKEGWEPVMPLYQKEIDGSVRILVRRPREDK